MIESYDESLKRFVGDGRGRGSAPMLMPQTSDRLPPHSIEAEQGVLGCCLLDAKCLPVVLERSDAARGGASGEVESLFYDLRHQALLGVLRELWLEGGAAGMDLIVVQQKLKDRNQLEALGGMGYLAGLMNAVPSAANLEYYLEILWEKFIFRKGLATAARMERGLVDGEGAVEAVLGRVEREFVEWQEMVARNFGVSPTVLKRAGEFGEGAWDRWFGEVEENPGWKMPFPFPLGLRLGELTLLSGDNGTGKTSMTSHIAIEVAKQIDAAQTGEKVCVASFEVSGDVTTWIMQRQLLGRGRLPDNDEGHKEFNKSLGWLNQRFWFHDFVGIGSWRDVLDAFAYARDHENCRFFILDSVMRIGIPEDDLAQQSLASAAMASFVMEKGKESHLMLVSHENKAGEGAKNRVQGSKRWSDNAHVFCQMLRNVKKGEAVAEAYEFLKSNDMAEREEGKKILEKQAEQWDSKFLLHKQRFPGARQNGSAHLFFDGGREGSLQFTKKRGEVVQYI